MPLDPVQVVEAMANGVSAVCATCLHYWSAYDKRLDSCGQPKCGGPIGGGTFPSYDGPMKGVLHKFCFVCSAPSKFGIRVNGSPRIIGACPKHIGYVKEYQRADGLPTVVLELRGDRLPDLNKQPKKTLGQAIAESEAEFDKADAAQRDSEGT